MRLPTLHNDKGGRIAASAVVDGLSYSKEHEWVKADGGSATVGITDFAQARQATAGGGSGSWFVPCDSLCPSSRSHAVSWCRKSWATWCMWSCQRSDQP